MIAGPYDPPMDRRLLKSRRSPSSRELAAQRKRFWQEKAENSKSYEQWKRENPGVIPLLDLRSLKEL